MVLHYTFACLGLSIVQNGKPPRFAGEEILNRLIQTSPSEDEDPCIVNLQKGLAHLGIIKVYTNNVKLYRSIYCSNHVHVGMGKNSIPYSFLYLMSQAKNVM